MDVTWRVRRTIKPEWLGSPNDKDIEEFAKGNVKLKIALKFIRDKLLKDERGVMIREEDKGVKEFKMPKKLPVWNGNYSNFTDDIEITMVTENID